MKKVSLFLILIMTLSVLSSISLAQTCIDADADDYTEDGAAACLHSGFSDCNDNDPNVNPGADEILGNGIDDNCDGVVDSVPCTDSDKDGYSIDVNNPACAVGGLYDCDDSTATISPGRIEIVGNNIDDNCNGQADEQPEVVVSGGSSGGGSGGSSCLDRAYWVDCDAIEITSAHEGDSVFAVVDSSYCDPDSEVSFDIKERNEQTSARIVVEVVSASSELDERFAGAWSALWEDDGTSDPDPEYVFDASIGSSSVSSPNPGLKVTQCITPDCEVTCDMPSGYSSIGGNGGSGSSDILVVACNPNWDCSGAEWSECDPNTETKTRDLSLCVFTGHGDAACQEQSMSELKSEESCLVGGDVTPQDKLQEKPKAKCNNNGKCDSGETTTSCPKDCPKPFPWVLVILIALLVLLVLGGLAYYFFALKKKPAVSGAAAGSAAVAGAQPEKSPFENPNDLNSVVNYIKLSKQRNVPDDKVIEMLRKSGWKEEQIKYAWSKSSQPQTAGMQKPVQPAK